MFRDKKKLIILILLVLIVGIIIVTVITATMKPKKITYEDLEDKVVQAAMSYYDTNQKYLPKENEDETSVSIKELVKSEYLKPLENLIEGGEKCSGLVNVKKINDNYSYTPQINCGKNYKTISMYDKILDDNETTETGAGLYIDNNSYNFKGEVENNYIKINGYNWRIMGIVDNSIKLIYADKLEKSIFDDRYNIDRESNYGKNDYKISRLHDNLKNILDGSAISINTNAPVEIFNTDFVAKLNKINVCTSPRSKEETDKSSTVECSQTLDNEYITLITVSEYLNASLDDNCKTTTDSACQNYNYLSQFGDNSGWWTITADSENSYKAYQISSYGLVSSNACNILSGVRPIVYLNGETSYKGGDGTKTNPYIVFSSDKIVEKE